MKHIECIGTLEGMKLESRSNGFDELLLWFLLVIPAQYNTRSDITRYDRSNWSPGSSTSTCSACWERRALWVQVLVLTYILVPGQPGTY